MTEVKELVKLAMDAHKGSVEKYSVKQSQDALREALIDLNGGSTVLDYRAIRDGKCNGLFTLVEELLEATVSEGLAANDFFTNFVDYRNVAEGDEAEFDVEDSTLFFVDEIADGTQTSDQLGGVAYFPTLANAYDEEDLLDVIAHVEAAAGGKTATIVGTKKALLKLIPSIQGDSYKEDHYNQGLNVAMSV